MSNTVIKVIKLVILFAATMAMIIAFSSMTIRSYNNNNEEIYTPPSLLLPSKRVSRFLAQNEKNGPTARNPNAADHCKQDNAICSQLAYGYGGKNSTCCNNKCMDLNDDDKNCGSCKNKCKYTQHCCGGKCVDFNFDKNHCGSCQNKCLSNQYCIYGLCDYA